LITPYTETPTPKIGTYRPGGPGGGSTDFERKLLSNQVYYRLIIISKKTGDSKLVVLGLKLGKDTVVKPDIVIDYGFMELETREVFEGKVSLNSK